jgi:hypothetical protein
MTGNSLWLIFAMLAQGILALALLWHLGATRIPLVMRGKIRMRDIALSKEPWPVRAQQASNAFDNQFQLPVLFYVGCFIAISFGATLMEVVLAAMFVLSRYVHGFIHITSNDVLRRFQAYFTGLVLLCLFWLDLLVRLILIAFGVH